MATTDYEDGLSAESFTSQDESSNSAEHSRSTNSITGTSGTGSGNADIRETTKMLKEDKKIRTIRAMSLAVLIATAIVVSTVVYRSLRSAEQLEFERRFSDQSSQIGQALESQLDVKLRAIDALSVTVTSYVESRSGGWPNITLPEFSYRSASTLSIGGGISINLQPIVYREDLEEWLEFSVQGQGWRAAGLDFQKKYPGALGSDGSDIDHDHRFLLEENLNVSLTDRDMDNGNTTNEDLEDDEHLDHDHEQIQNISEYIFEVIDGIPTKVEDAEIMLPVWQNSPVHDGLPWVNYDLYRKERSVGALQEVLEQQSAVLGQVFELAASFHG
jgi:hypothetical protein